MLEHGWPAKDRELVVWLDKLYAGEWPALLKQAADLPTSPLDDVAQLDHPGTDTSNGQLK